MKTLVIRQHILRRSSPVESVLTFHLVKHGEHIPQTRLGSFWSSLIPTATPTGCLVPAGSGELGPRHNSLHINNDASFLCTPLRPPSIQFPSTNPPVFPIDFAHENQRVVPNVTTSS
jgi:hypothetical protein